VSRHHLLRRSWEVLPDDEVIDAAFGSPNHAESESHLLDHLFNLGASKAPQQRTASRGVVGFQA
jgi:hypothetical protein